MKLKLIITYFTILLFAACSTNTVKVKNEKQGCLKATVKLEVSEVKKIVLDENSAPKPEYTQLYNTTDGKRHFTFLNKYNNSIYFYDYNALTFEKKIVWEKKGPNGISGIQGYHIKSLDSIYLYNRHTIEIILANNKGEILHKTSLRGNGNDPQWGLKYPQYNPLTVVPFIETAHELLLTGFFFGAIPENIISDFKLTSRLDFKTKQLKFNHGYPLSLYGNNYNWDGEIFTTVFSDIHPDGDKLLFSFPVSHDLYIADLNTGEYKKVYAGSNFAGTIYSIDKSPKQTTNEHILNHFKKQDIYTAIKYDKFRKLYYRFLLKSIPNSTLKTKWQEKSIAVIIMDEHFNYLGETIIGNGIDWNWQNSFVTEEGLNIEFIEKDFKEVYITLKIFTVKKI